MKRLEIVRTGFDCPRTCPQFETRDVCRFNQLFSAAGVSASVSSVTVSVSVEFRRIDALTAAVETLGGRVLGFGDWELYERSAETRTRKTYNGLAFSLPGWQFPLVCSADGKLSFDDFEGRWGNPADVETLRAEYALTAAELAAASVGWPAERTADGLRVFHPAGGWLDVAKSGAIDAVGFRGVGCHGSAATLADFIGRESDAETKPEYNRETAYNVL